MPTYVSANEQLYTFANSTATVALLAQKSITERGAIAPIAAYVTP